MATCLLNHFNERVLYGLRTNNGIPIEILQELETKYYLEPSLKKWKNHLDISKESICLRPGHYHLADDIASDMMMSD